MSSTTACKIINVARWDAWLPSVSVQLCHFLTIEGPMTARPLLRTVFCISASWIPCGCAAPLDQSGFKSLNQGYVAIDPIELPIDRAGGEKTIGTKALKDAQLTSMGTVSSQFRVNTDGTMSVAGSTAKNTTEYLRLYSDNLLYRIIVKVYTVSATPIPEASPKAAASTNGSPTTDKPADKPADKAPDKAADKSPSIKAPEQRLYTIPVSLVVGVGSRIEGMISMEHGSLNIGSLPGFSLAGSVSVKSATASVQTVGVMSDSLITLPRFSGEITVENMYTFFQVLAIINAEMVKDTTKITPHIMGFYVSAVPPGLDLGLVVNEIRNDAALHNDVKAFSEMAAPPHSMAPK